MLLRQCHLLPLHIRHGIGGQFNITQRSPLCNLYENSCSSCKQTISPAEQWYLRCHFKAFGDRPLQYLKKILCCHFLMELHWARVNNVVICLIQVFTPLTTKLDRAIPMFASAETGSQLMTATPYSQHRCIPSTILSTVSGGICPKIKPQKVEFVHL
jgi:hypothetical protein